jgi:hypothetical protein
MIRNRIKSHRRIRAGDLIPHEWNFRAHPEHQKATLKALYDQVGFARSLLAYELPDGRLKLIDGHLRRDIHPDMEVDVEVLDLNDEEARALLLSLDPLASLAETQLALHERLQELTPTTSPELEALWEETAEKCLKTPPPAADESMKIVSRFLVMIECRDEEHQVELLGRFQREGLECRAVVG